MPERRARRLRRTAILTFPGTAAGAAAIAYLYYPANEFQPGTAALVGVIAFVVLLPIVFAAVTVATSLTSHRKR